MHVNRKEGDAIYLAGSRKRWRRPTLPESCFVGIVTIIEFAFTYHSLGTFITLRLYPPPYETTKVYESSVQQVVKKKKEELTLWILIAIILQILYKFNSYREFDNTNSNLNSQRGREDIRLTVDGIECVLRVYLRRACADSSGGDLKMVERACRCLDTFYERCMHRFQNCWILMDDFY